MRKKLTANQVHTLELLSKRWTVLSVTCNGNVFEILTRGHCVKRLHYKTAAWLLMYKVVDKSGPNTYRIRKKWKLKPFKFKNIQL